MCCTELNSQGVIGWLVVGDEIMDADRIIHHG